MSSLFSEELEALINKYSQENGSDTPDWILAKYLVDTLALFNMTVNKRAKWYGNLNDNLPPAHKTKQPK